MSDDMPDIAIIWYVLHIYDMGGCIECTYQLPKSEKCRRDESMLQDWNNRRDRYKGGHFYFNGSQLAKMEKYMPVMSLP